MRKKYYLTLFLSFSVFLNIAAQECNVPTAVSISSVAGTSAVFSWSTGSETQWEVLVLPQGSPEPMVSTSGIITSTNQYMMTGLTPCTQYMAYVRANCLPGVVSDWSGAFHFSTMSAISSTAFVTAGVMCSGGNEASITAIASGGQPPYAFTLLSSGTAIGPVSSNVFSGLSAGTYQVQVADVNGCSSIANSVIIQNPNPLNFTFTTNASQDTVTIHPVGGSAPYIFSIAAPVASATPFQASGVFSGLPLGTYTFNLQDANGCITSNTITLTGSGFSVFIDASLDMPTSTLFANVIGGVGPYTYQWGFNGVGIPGTSGPVFSVIGQSGTFSVTVTDDNGLIASAEYFVTGIPVAANDDTFSICPVNGNFAVSQYSVFSNDYHGSSTSYPAVTVLTIPNGFILNPDGTVSVLSGTPPGIYTLIYQICSTINPNDCDTATATITVVNDGILLNAFIDWNNNGTQEVNEPNFTQGQFGYEVNNDGIVNYASSSNGEYLIGVPNPTNSYDLSYVINPVYASQYTLTTSSYSDVSVVSGSGITTYNFPVTQVPFHDLAVYVFQYGVPPRPGFTYMNQIMYRNNGNQSIASGTVTFNKDNAVAITNVSVAGITNTATGFTYDFINLLPGETRYINVTMQVPTIPTVALGNILTNTAQITAPVGDINPSNNNGSLSQTIVGSYDPNDKSEVHGGKILHSAFTSNDYLTYTIQFENTGTANAENVSVEDFLDSKLDETSVKVIDASHAYTLTRTGDRLSWSFVGIELPPSVANTTIGKGYINFQVKPKPGYSIGDIIPNTASIFFDFNPAIVTNTFDTEFVAALGVSEFENENFKAYPNPTNGFVTISLKNNVEVIDAVIVNDILGKTIQTQTFNTSNAVIDLSHVSKGIYFVKVISAGQEKVMKVIRE